jgi:hypothetical protein
MVMFTALSLKTSNGFLVEEIVAFCQEHDIRFSLSYQKYGEWEVRFNNTTDVEIVKMRKFANTVCEDQYESRVGDGR